MSAKGPGFGPARFQEWGAKMAEQVNRNAPKAGTGTSVHESEDGTATNVSPSPFSGDTQPGGGGGAGGGSLDATIVELDVCVDGVVKTVRFFTDGGIPD